MSTSGSQKWLRNAVILVFGTFTAMYLAFLVADPGAFLRSDWVAFDNAADRVFAGEDLYRPFDRELEPLPYLYPPFALWLAAPLAALSLGWSYALAAASAVFLFGVGIRNMSKAAAAHVDRTTALVLAFCSGSTIALGVTGQYSGLFAMVFGTAALLWCQGKQQWTGLLLALLWIKPNLAVVVPVVLVWSRSWPALRAHIAGMATLLISSAPWGLHRWPEFFDAASSATELHQTAEVPVHKSLPIANAFQHLTGVEGFTTPVLAVWLVAAAVLGGAVLILWTPRRLAADPARAFAALAIFAVAANLRGYFYEGTLLAVGVLGLWLSVHSSAYRPTSRMMSALGVATWVGLWGAVFSPLNAVVSLFAAAALLVTTFDVLQLERRLESDSPSGPVEVDWCLY